MNKVLYCLLLICLSLFLIGCTKEDDLIKTDDTKYIYKIDDNSFYAFYYTDDIIYDMEYYTSLSDADTAYNSIVLFEEMYEDDENVESISSNDKYIVINYKEGYVEKTFSTNSLSVIKTMTIIE